MVETRITTALLLLLLGVAASADAQEPGAEARLEELGLELPTPYEPFANYVRAVRSGPLVFLGGPTECEDYTTGKVGKDRTLDEAYQAARGTALCMLGTLKAEIGDLDKVVRIVRLVGMVNATDDFTQHSQVINGASDLLVDVFGERGRHARAAVVVVSIPVNITVEITMIVEVED